MIQPSAMPAKANPAASTGNQPGSVENGTVPAGFAALLTLGLAEETEADTAEALAEKASAALLRQTTGKSGGKDLPEGDSVAGEEAEGSTETTPGAPDGSDADADPSLAVTSNPGHSQSAIEAVNKALEKQHPGDGKSQRTQALTDVLAKFAEGLPTNRISGTAEAATSDPNETGTDARQQLQIKAELRAETKVASPAQSQIAKAPVAAAKLPAQDLNLGTRLTASAPATSTTETAKVAIQVSLSIPNARRQSPRQTETTGEIPSPPVSTNSRIQQAISPVVSVSRPAIAATIAGDALGDAAQLKEAEAAADPGRAENAGKLISTTGRPIRLAQNSAQSSEIAPGATAKPLASIELASDGAMPRAGDLQPVLAVREAHAPLPGASNPLHTASLGTSQPGPVDFAALVDRLVEAREAAAPQAVRATLAHAEFGQVSLRFDQSAGGLTVSMASSDPDFAPAVQAATSGQGTNSGDSNQNAARQDAQGQQSTGTASGQPQQQSQGSARDSERARSEAASQNAVNSGSLTPEETDPDGRDGIYA